MNDWIVVNCLLHCIVINIVYALGSHDVINLPPCVIHLQVCGLGKRCVPRHTSFVTFHLITGPVTKEIIKECHCQGTPSKCKRRKRFVTYFEGSSFEQTIDIGECLGTCSGFGLSEHNSISICIKVFYACTQINSA